ncbi:MAG TPA: NAD(P)-binding domain-containing protein [Actinomycetes bacterium]|jgi:putative flavoprotein involved in K+ transport|nr:NAD(P)-binding domain-containing protein [Actinomycetes bacterium]
MNRQATQQEYAPRPASSAAPERFETVIVGGGQAGLAVGYYLARRGRPFVILDAHRRVGDAWRQRWDSLRLFTPARYDGLPGMPFPAPAFSYPTKDQVADYLEAYAARFNLPVRSGVRVDRLWRDGDRYVLAAGDRRLQADHVVVASGAYQRPRIPAFAAELDPAILQLDPNRYRDPSQLPGGGVLVVGAGNSGAEIAFEVSRAHPTWLSGPDTGRIPVRSGSRWDRLLTPLFWWFASRVLTVQTPIGRRVRPKALTTTAPLERVRPKELAAAGVERVPRTVGVRDGSPLLEDGRVMDVATVLWCTGFRPDFAFIDLPVFDQDGAPMHHRGVVGSQPGLYFLGLWFLSAFTSSLLGGVGSDAEHVAEQIASRQPDGRPAAEVLTGARRAGQLD